MNQIPVCPNEASRFFAKLPGNHKGKTLRDSVSPILRLLVGKTTATFLVRVKIAGQTKSRKIGRLGDITLEQARASASNLLQHRAAFRSEEDFLFILRKAQNALKPLPTVRQAFETAMANRIDRNRIKPKTVRNKRSALLAAGKGLCEARLDSVDYEALRTAAKAVHAQYGAEKLNNFKSASFWAWQHAVDNGLPGIDRNIAAELKHLKIRTEEKAACTRSSLTWDQVKTLWHWLSDPRCPLAPVEIRLYKTILLTGERVDALCNAKWTDLGEDGWWIIPPQNRKTLARLLDRADPLCIFVTQVLSEVLGEPSSNSPYIFPAKRNLHKPYPTSSLPLWALFRARDYLWMHSGKENLVAPEHAEYARNYLERRYTHFPLPDDLPRCCHHEMGRHTLATLAQEEGIPGFLVSKMLGHVDTRKQPGSPDLTVNSTCQQRRTLTISRTLLRTASAAQGLSRVTQRYYIHTAAQLPFIQEAWIIWSEIFCRRVMGEVPEGLAKAAAQLRCTEEKILDLLIERFGSVEAALKNLDLGNGKPNKSPGSKKSA